MSKDRKAELEQAYRENKGGFLSWAARATRSMTDAEDLVQDAFARALANIESLSAVEDLAAWLFASVRNRVRDRWRKTEVRKRAGETELADETIDEIVAAAGLDPAELAAEAELIEALYDAIEELPPEQRMVIEAQVLDGLTFRELAEQSGISPDTLAARKRYAIRKLAGALREWMDD
jgi:RNA polymerase sigma factor (sigma-70 family)